MRSPRVRFLTSYRLPPGPGLVLFTNWRNGVHVSSRAPGCSCKCPLQVRCRAPSHCHNCLFVASLLWFFSYGSFLKVFIVINILLDWSKRRTPCWALILAPAFKLQCLQRCDAAMGLWGKRPAHPLPPAWGVAKCWCVFWGRCVPGVPPGTRDLPGTPRRIAAPRAAAMSTRWHVRLLFVQAPGHGASARNPRWVTGRGHCLFSPGMPLHFHVRRRCADAYVSGVGAAMFAGMAAAWPRRLTSAVAGGGAHGPSQRGWDQQDQYVEHWDVVVGIGVSCQGFC